MLAALELFRADFFTQRAIRRQTTHSSLNSSIGFVCFCVCGNRPQFHDSKGWVTTFRTLDTVGDGPSTRPTSLPFRNMIKVGVP